MTEREKMMAGELYDPADEELSSEQMGWLRKLWEFNQLRPDQIEEMRAYMQEVFAECGENNYIQLPFHANWGGHHVHFGSNIYANFNLTCVDDGHIYVGDWTQFGPNVTIATANHPLNADLRAKALQYNKDVHIGENSWIGADVTILPGVTIGKNVVVGAGSVVTKDIPPFSIFGGVPAKLIRMR